MSSKASYLVKALATGNNDGTLSCSSKQEANKCKSFTMFAQNILWLF